MDVTLMNLFTTYVLVVSARCVWGGVQVSFNISPPLNIEHLFDN
jgi:hypothetical protein